MRLLDSYLAKILLIYLVFGVLLLVIGNGFLSNEILKFLIITLSISFFAIPIIGLLQRKEHLAKTGEDLRQNLQLRKILFIIVIAIALGGMILHYSGLMPESFYSVSTENNG